MSYRRTLLGLLLTGIMISGTINPALLLLDDKNDNIERATGEETGFSGQNFLLNKVKKNTTTNEMELQRPEITWAQTTGGGLMITRAHGCMAHDTTNELVYLMGGRTDPDPQQTNDESSTNLIEIWNQSTETWSLAQFSMPDAQQYHECVQINDKIYSIGDWYPNVSPARKSSGQVQIYDLAAEEWMNNTTSMPPSKEVGNFGMASIGTKIYIAGGVQNSSANDATDRLLEYDTVTGIWTELANMTEKRFAFPLVEYHGLLYAFGGLQGAYTWVNQPVTNTSEVYDPATNTWTRLPNMSFHRFGMAASVHNDEIVLIGGHSQSAAVKDTWGYVPSSNEWRKQDDLLIGIFDLAAIDADGVTVFAGGDLSSQPYGTGWGVQYLDETGIAPKIDNHTGWISSPINNLATTEHGSASLMWMELSGSTPTSTSIGFQYRVSNSESGVASETWKPIDTLNPSNLALLGIGNHSLSGIAASDKGLMEYRIQLYTEEVQNWEIPNLNSIRWGAEEASFSLSNPTAIQPNAPQITFSSHHAAMEGQLSQPAVFEFAMIKATPEGFIHPNAVWTTIRVSPDGSTPVVSDTDNLLDSSSVSIGAPINGVRDVDWALSFNDMDTDKVLIRTSTEGVATSTYTHVTPVDIDRSITVFIDDITSNFSTQGGNEVSPGEVLRGGSSLSVSVDHAYSSSGLRPLSNNIKARIHIDVELRTQGVNTGQPWYNTSTAFVSLSANQATVFIASLPSNVSGQTTVRLEAQTTDSLELQVDPAASSASFLLDSFAPIIMTTSPLVDSYLNTDGNRTVTLNVYDAVGFEQDAIQSYVWLEGVHDANGNGISEVNERILIEHEAINIGTSWQFSLQLNETGNAEGEAVQVYLEGTDRDGREILTNGQEQGHLYWTSRLPTKSTIVSVDERYPTENGVAQRLEPTKVSGWDVVVRDDNGLGDINTVRITLGGDDDLGLLYRSNEGCSSLDGRLAVTENCLGTVVGDELHIAFDFEVMWQMKSSGINIGVLQVRTYDEDGFTFHDDVNAWTFERDLTVTIDSMEDISGDVEQSTAGPLVTNAALKVNDLIQVTGTVEHTTSGEAYSGTVALRWDGQFQATDWIGGQTVIVEDGVFVTTFSVPESSGKIFNAEIEIWDPIENERFLVNEFPDLIIDGDAPILLTSTFNQISRFDLRQVDIGANIEEPQSWTSGLAMTCQVTSTTIEWEPITLVREPMDVFDGRTLFSFRFNFTESGQPSLLGSQASLNCWASGIDDAGWNLIAQGTNSQEAPWTSISLTSAGPDLQISKVNFDDDLVANSQVTATIQIFNSGERIEDSFNVSVYMNKGEAETLIAQKTFAGLDTSEAGNMRILVDVPEGSWLLNVVIDSNEVIAELDEMNNNWSKSYDSSGQGFSSVVIIAGGSLVGIVAAAVVLLRLRKAPSGGIEKPDEGQEEVKEVPSIQKKVGPANVSAPNTGPKKRGPPPAQPKPAPVEQSPAETAAAQFAALDALTPTKEVERVASWESLPAGGDYDYTTEGTFYVGETCGKWKLLDDGQFEKME
ncbi:MAG: CARDB domain-containing protein [Candidatus Poseidoniaceae archaeon]